MDEEVLNDEVGLNEEVFNEDGLPPDKEALNTLIFVSEFSRPWDTFSGTCCGTSTQG